MNGTPSTAVATRNGTVARSQPGALAISAGQPEWTPMQQAALGQLGLKDAPDGDRQVFLHVSQRTGLDPFARQIYMIPRNEKQRVQRNGQWTDAWGVKWTIQTGIEGWRVIRDRAERREGVRGKLSRAIWYDDKSNESKVWVSSDPPSACELTYTVRDANGIETEYTSVLNFWEYAQTDQQGNLIAQWKVKKAHMLEKCTEADVYRKAFPTDFSGLVLDDAMPAERMTDEELAAAYATQPERQRVTGAQARERAQQARPQQPQRVTAALVDPAGGEELPPPPDAPMGQQPQAPARQQPAPPGDRNPRDGVLAQFDRLKVTAVAERLDYAARLLQIEPIGGLDVLTADEMETLIPILARAGNRAQLDEQLATGTAPE